MPLKKIETLTFGTARLMRGHARLSRGKKEGVSASQLRAIFEDLDGMSDAAIDGFIDIGDKLISGEVDIPKTAFRPDDDHCNRNRKS